jgi:anaerobic magnesium-protoporphyrin IX monomethyl ester cyclase
MSEILFGQSYYLRFDPKLWEAMQPYPPLGTLYATSLLRSRGYTVALFDAMLAGSEAEWSAALDRERPRFAVLFEDNFNYLSKMCLLRMREAAFRMIAAARRRDRTLIVCGADATDHAAEYLSRGADFVLLGEGEQTLLELVDRLSGRSEVPFESILGLAFKRPNGASGGPTDAAGLDQLKGEGFFQTPRRPDLKDLDALPFPAWDLVDVERYRSIWLRRHGYFSMNMAATRGCPYHCNWCAKPIWGQRYNLRSPENTAAELKWLRETYAPDHINFVDDILGLKPGWLPRFADLVQEQGTPLPFKCLSRADLLLRPGEIEALQRAGCRTVWVGAESGSQKILDAMEKGTRVEQIAEAARRLHAAGIQIGFFLQFGYPGETRQDIEKTLQMVRDCQPDDIGMSVSYPLPGTKFYTAVREQLGRQQNWIDSSDLAMLYRGPFTTEFYRQLHRVLHTEFRRHKARQGIRGLGEKGIRGKLWPVFKAAAAWVRHSAGLTLARWKLERLARALHQGVRPLPAGLSREAAAEPSAQEG